MPQTDIHKLDRLLTARQASIAMITFEEDYALDVIRQSAMGRGCMWVWSCSRGLRDGLVSDSAPVPETEHPAAALYMVATDLTFTGVLTFLDLGPHLEKCEKSRRLLRELINQLAETHRATVVLVDSGEVLPPSIRSVSAELELTFPGEEELNDIVRRTCQDLSKTMKIDVSLTRGQLATIVRNLRGLTRRQARQAIMEAVATDRVFNASDVDTILAFKRNVLGKTGLLEFVEAPLDMDQIGGLSKLKAWLNLRRDAFTPAAREFGIEPPRGVLLLGVQGAGKSLAAKAVATAWQRPLLRMDVGAFFNKFVGETERNMRDAFRQAEMMSPVVLWIDEIEKAFASASAQSADGGLSKRMFGGLLTWMQEHKSGAFLIATANDIESLPPELLRKGRFDEIFFVDLPSPVAREQIFRIHLKRRNQNPDHFELEPMVEASDGFSGSEIEQAIRSALFTAFSTGTTLSTRQIVEVMKNSPPLSVTARERIDWLRSWARDRCVPAD